MRRNSSRRTQALLIALTILGALGVGYAIAFVTTGPVAPAPPVEIVAPQDTETAVAELLPTYTPRPSVQPTASARPQATADSTTSATTTADEPPETPVAETSSVFVDETFDDPQETSRFRTQETDTWSAQVVDGRYQMTLNGQTFIGFSVEMPPNNYRLGVDVGVAQGGAGIVFLYSAPNSYYRLIVTPDGAYAIERQEDDTATREVDFTASPALRTEPGATNRLEIERQGNIVRLLANGQLLQDFPVPLGEFENRYGFVITSRSGQGSATFDNVRGETLP